MKIIIMMLLLLLTACSSELPTTQTPPTHDKVATTQNPINYQDGKQKQFYVKVQFQYVDTKFEAISGFCNKLNRIKTPDEKIIKFKDKFICGVILTFTHRGYQCDMMDDVRSLDAYALYGIYETMDGKTRYNVYDANHTKRGYTPWDVIIKGFNYVTNKPYCTKIETKL